MSLRNVSRNVHGQGLSFRPFIFSHVCRLPSSLSESIYRNVFISLGLNIVGNMQDNVSTQPKKLLYITKVFLKKKKNILMWKCYTLYLKWFEMCKTTSRILYCK